MAIDQETIKKTANLAHLELTDEEVKLYVHQLGAILEYVSLLGKVPTDGVAPLVTATDMAFTFRTDEIQKNPNPENATQNAPDKLGNLFKVPPVL